MIGFAAPWIFGVALAAALMITTLHFLSVRQPRVRLLPTARFIPERDARAVARQAKPSDLPLLLWRVIALLAAGAALAGARCGARNAHTASIVVIDEASRADSVALLSRAMPAPSSSSEVDVDPPVVLWVHGVSDDPGVAIAAAIREAARLAQINRALATLSLTVVMPETVRSRRGWDAWRDQWPGRIRVVGSAPSLATDSSPMMMSTRSASGSVRVESAGIAPGTDVVAAAFAWRDAGSLRTSAMDTADVVVHRSMPDRTANARATVLWPVNGVPPGWRALPAADSVGAVVAAGVALIAPWVRTAMPPPLSDSVRAIAWWSDGVAAAVERTRGTSCVRDVAITVAQGSDLLLSPAADGLLRVLRAPCGGVALPAPKEPADTSAAAASRFRNRDVAMRTTEPAWLAVVLLAVAFVALLVEQIVRRDSAGAAAT